jgi:hypothetical protein
MEHGAGQAYLGDRAAIRHPSYAGGADREDVELFLVPNEYAAGAVAGGLPRARSRSSAARSSTTCRARMDLTNDPRSRSASTGRPSWRPRRARRSATTARPARAREAFNVIGHAHPKADWPARIQRYYRRAGIPFVADFDDVCRQADVYVCDNSSTLFEFAATGRPVVVLNAPGLPAERQPRRPLLGLGRRRDPGRPAGDLVAAIARALEDPPEVRAERERVLELVYPVRTARPRRPRRSPTG